MTRPSISARDITRSFGGSQVLRGVTVDVAPGEVFGLVGANGAGKTTFVEILATLLQPTSGQALVCGLDVVASASEVRSSIGYCPSSLHSFYPRLTGAQNLRFFAALAGLSRRDAADRTAGLLERVGLADAGTVRFERYSDGMKGRLSIARALLADAPVLLLDEPTKSLDSEGRSTIGTLIADLAAGGRCVLWVTHALDEAAERCDRVGVLEDGRLGAVGAPREVFAGRGARRSRLRAC